MAVWTVYIASIQSEAFYVGISNCMPHRTHSHGRMNSSPIFRYIQNHGLTINNVSFWEFAKFSSKKDALRLETMLIRLLSYHKSLNTLNINKTFKRKHNSIPLPVDIDEFDDYDLADELDSHFSDRRDVYRLKKIIDTNFCPVGVSQKDQLYKEVVAIISEKYSIKELQSFLKISLHN